MGQNTNINLGRKGQFGKINLAALKSGVKKSDNKNTEQIELFKKFDTDQNGILTQDEMQKLVNSLGSYAQDGKITKREAKKFVKQNGLKGEVDKKQVFELLKNLGIASDNIDKTTIDGENINIRYNKSEDGSILTETLNKSDGALNCKTIEKDGKTVVQMFDDNGKIKQETTTENGVTTVVNYDENGNVTSTVRTKGAVTEYIENGRVTKKEVNKGLGGIQTTEYEYDKDGNVLKTTTTNPDGSQVIDDGTTTTTINPDGTKTVTNNETKEVQKFDKNGQLIEEEPEQVSTQDALKKLFGENRKASVTIDGTETGLSNKAYQGEIRLPQGQTIEDGKFPQTLRMSLPKSYGDNAAMKLTLIDPENGIYQSSAGDRNFQITTDENGNITVKSINVDELSGKLNANLAEYKRIAEEKRQQEETSEIQKRNETVRKEGSQIAEALYKDMDGMGTDKTFESNLNKINKDNVASVILSYREFSPDESLTEAILDETGISKEERRQYLKDIFSKLVSKAKESGIDTQQYETQFNSKINTATTYGSDEFDAIFEGLASGINGASILTSADKAQIAKMTPEQQKNETITHLTTVADNSEESFEKQLAQDGWAGKTVDWMSGLWNSDNRKDVVDADIKAYRAQIAELQNTSTEAEFKTKFKEIFGVEYNPQMIKAYEKRQQQLVLARATYGIEQNFNDSLSVLLKDSELAEESKYVQTSSSQYGASGKYVITATKDEVYNREFNAFAEFIGQGDIADGKRQLEKGMTEAGLDLNTASNEQKYAVLHKLAQEYSNTLHNNVLQATENKGYEAFNNECTASYNAAFGIKNDIARRVQDYNTSQQTGAMILKSTVKGLGAVGLCLIPGVGVAAAAVGTATLSATVDASDRMSSKVGLQEGELLEILKNASIDGATVFAGGQLTKMLANAKTFAKIGGQMTGDIVVGAAAEKMQTGEITLSGVAFQAVFSAAGNLVALKKIGKPSATDTPVPNQGVEPPLNHKGEVNNHRDFVADGEVARNIDQRHLNENQRRMVAEGLEDIPNEADIAAFRRQLGEAPTPEQRADIEANNARAAEANAKAHQIGENIPDDAAAKLRGEIADAPLAPVTSPEIKALENDIKGLDGSIRHLESQIKGAKKYGKNTQALETQLEVMKQRRAAKAAELETLQKPAPKAETPAESAETPDDLVAYNVVESGQDFAKGVPSVVDGNSKLILGGQYELDLSSPNIKARLDALKDGETITVGRNGDIKTPDYMMSVSRNHLEITKQGNDIVITDISTNGTRVAMSVDNLHVSGGSAVDVSNSFAKTSHIDADSKVPDGYRDAGRGRSFNNDGSLATNPNREIVLVDRTRDKYLSNLIDDVKVKTSRMTDKQKAEFLQDYIAKISGDSHLADKNSRIFANNNKGKEVLLGDIFNQGQPTAVCRHRSLLYKILGDELGLKVELQRGNFRTSPNNGGGHAWNVVRFEDGTAAIFDAMHGKTSSITPGHIDDYAKYYKSTKDVDLY